MRKIVKKGMALASVTIMIAGSMPMTAVNISAAENDGKQIAVQSEQGTEIQAEQDISVQADSETASGTWGTCEWTYDNGTLTIGGGVGGSCTGEYGARPWDRYRESIKNVVITDKVTFAPKTKLVRLFAYMAVETIDGIDNLETSNVTDMSDMFAGCEKLQTLDLSGFDTSNVTNMRGMFVSCSGLKSLNISSFDTSNVTDMNAMFSSCFVLSNLDLSNFHTDKVKDMSYMFANCEELPELDVRIFDTGNVENMEQMFLGSKKIKNLDLSNFHTEKVTNMSYMFAGCKELSSLNVSSFNTSNVTDMRDMFMGCAGLEKLDVSSFDTSNVTDMSSMFYSIGCEQLDLGKFNTSNVTRMDDMFNACSKLKSIDVSSFDTSNVTNMSGMFSGCTKLESLDLSNFNTSKVVIMSNMFARCSGLTSLDVSGFDTSKVTDIMYMFYNCRKLMELNISSFDLSNVNMYMYSNWFNNWLIKINMPDKMPADKDTFKKELKNKMRTGSWKDVTSNITYENIDSLVIEEGHTYVFCPEEMRVSITIDNKDEVNKKVTLNAAVEGGVSGYTYQFIMHNPADDSWTVLRDYSNVKTYTWDIVDNRELYVNVKDSAGNVKRSEALIIDSQGDKSDTIEEVIKNNNLGYTVNKDSSGTQLLTGVKPALKADSFKTGFGTNITVKSADGTELAADAAVGTGCVVELIQDNKVVDSATVVVKGDTDGNGSIDVLDMEAIQKSILGIGDKLSGAYKEAASLTGGKDISVLDMEAIQKDILGIQKIN